jgi:hypothetical protein
MQASESTAPVSKLLTASISSSGPPSHRQPVTPSTTFSSSPPAARAITGRPAAWASTDAIPNSSPVVTTSARQVDKSRAASSSLTRPAKRIVGPASWRRRRRSGPPPVTTSGRPMRLKASMATSICLCDTSSESTGQLAALRKAHRNRNR